MEKIKVRNIIWIILVIMAMVMAYYNNKSIEENKKVQTKKQLEELFLKKPNIDFKSLSTKDE